MLEICENCKGNLLVKLSKDLERVDTFTLYT